MKRKKFLIQIGIILLFCIFLIFIIKLPHFFMIKNYTLSKEYPFTQNGIREALKTIKDPEIDINIVDLGLIQDIQIDENKNVKITLIFTSSLCPLTQVIKEDIEKTVRKNFKTKKVKVVSDDTKLWNVDMMTEDGKENFKDFFK